MYVCVYMWNLYAFWNVCLECERPTHFDFRSIAIAVHFDSVLSLGIMFEYHLILKTGIEKPFLAPFRRKWYLKQKKKRRKSICKCRFSNYTYYLNYNSIVSSEIELGFWAISGEHGDKMKSAAQNREWIRRSEKRNTDA